MLNRTFRALLLLLSTLVFFPAAATAQNASAPAAPQPLPPFDELELNAFLDAGPTPFYVAQVLRERGSDFVPSDSRIAIIKSEQIRETLQHLPSRPHKALPQNRQQSLDALNRAESSCHAKQPVLAAQNFEEAIRLTPDSASLHFAFAACRMSFQDWPEVVHESRESLRLWPDNADAHMLLAYALNAQGRPQDAIPEAREVLRISFNHPGAAMQLGIALARIGQFAEAVPYLQYTSETFPGPLVDKFLGYSLLETNKPSDAIEPLNRFLAKYPDDAETHYLLGTAFRSLGRKAEAASQFDQALKLAPSNPRYYAAVHPEASTLPGTAERKIDPGSVTDRVYSNTSLGMTYEFPDGWTVLSANAGRALGEFGSVMMSTGAPTEQETMKVALQTGSSLLTLVQRGSPQSGVLAPEMIQIVAFDAREAPNLDALYLSKAILQRVQQSGATVAPNGEPRMVNLAGRDFVRSQVSFHTAAGQIYTSSFVIKQRGVFLLFKLSAMDAAAVLDLEGTLKSLQFQPDSE